MKTTRTGIYHNKDMDGFFSGAVLLQKFPDIKLIGWDYKDPLPNIKELEEQDEVILIDITFPLDVLQSLGQKTNLTVIDHHISFFNEVEELYRTDNEVFFEYIYDSILSACEIGYKYYFGFVPEMLSYIGDYDTWRKNGADEWEKITLPIKYYLYSTIQKPTDVPQWMFLKGVSRDSLQDIVKTGTHIMNYEDMINETKTSSYSFEIENVFGQYTALCINTGMFCSEIMKSKYTPEKHDLAIGFVYDGKKWIVSLRSELVDVSLIAKERGGGGHKGAAGFSVDLFEEIFK